MNPGETAEQLLQNVMLFERFDGAHSPFPNATMIATSARYKTRAELKADIEQGLLAYAAERAMPAPHKDDLERVAIALSLADPDERGLPEGAGMAELYRGLARAAIAAMPEVAASSARAADIERIAGEKQDCLAEEIEALRNDLGKQDAYAAERERLLAEADAALYTTRYALGRGGRGGERHLCMPAVDYSRAAKEACERHRARSSSPAQDEGKPTT